MQGGTSEAIQRVIKGVVDTSDIARKKASQDASIFEVMPEAVVTPVDADDIKSLVKYAVQQTRDGRKVSLTARNGGTCMSGGPLTESYVVNMKHLNGIGAVDTAGYTLRVQGGVMHRHIEEVTHPLGLLFAPYTSSHEICGIGGMIGNNASGEKSIKYGATSKNINELKVVLSDGQEYTFGPLTRAEVEAKKRQPDFEGRLYRGVTELLERYRSLITEKRPRTRKNAAGYALWELWDEHEQTFNMARLFIGAQGTLGIVTEAELKLVRMNKYSRMIVTPISDLTTLPDVVRTMLHFSPTSCETFDHYTYELAKQYFPEDAARAQVAEGKHIVILSTYEGNDIHDTDILVGKAKEALEAKGYETHWIDDPATIESFLNIRRQSFKMLLDHPGEGQRAMAFLEDTIVPLDRYDEFLVRLENILKDYNMTYTYAGHIGDGSIRLIPLVNMEADGAAEQIMELETKVNDLTLEFGGSISVDHNDGIIRTPYLEKQFGHDMIRLFAMVKLLFDPHNIFNPGKKIGGSYEYALSKIIRKNG